MTLPKPNSRLTRQRCHLFKEKDNPSYQMPPERAQILRPNSPATSQVKRFADIMSALA